MDVARGSSKMEVYIAGLQVEIPMNPVVAVVPSKKILKPVWLSKTSHQITVHIHGA
jgi:hypothetical protein